MLSPLLVRRPPRTQSRDDKRRRIRCVSCAGGDAAACARGDRVGRVDVAVEALDGDRGGRVAVAPRNAVEAQRLGARLHERLPDGFVADLRDGDGAALGQRRGGEELAVGAQVHLGVAGALEQVGAGLDDERPPRLGAAGAVEAGDPTPLAAVPRRVVARRLIVQVPLLSAGELLELPAQVLPLEHELVQAFDRDRRSGAPATGEGHR